MTRYKNILSRHRANSIHAGLDDNVDLRNIKFNGEIQHGSIVDLLCHIMTIDEHFDKDLDDARKRVSRTASRFDMFKCLNVGAFIL